jgi:hypothetical protein
MAEIERRRGAGIDTWSGQQQQQQWSGRNRSYSDPDRNRTYREGQRSDTWRNSDRGDPGRWSGRDETWRNDPGRWNGNGSGWRNDGNRWGNRWSNGNSRGWDRNWRRDSRYDWSSYRNSHRSVYRLGRYYSPYRGYAYRRLGVGFYLDSLFFGSNYWIDDPWYYRLPPADGPYRWIRYYGDALLVDTYSGEVIDVIYDFFE